ncbi:hypothetical protein NQ317_009459 [Molorchus minor]|uniref:Uncharacterized protein n=1 Tax=Molorchus minor TaxID=1323400 RepID=A0ABQ9JML8_9CUCU|nr:hypothetical protein NQ317_009459 [Molorchus minor]
MKNILLQRILCLTLKKPLSAHELLEEAKKIGIDGNQIDIYVTLPDDGEITEEDSGDEEANDPDHLSARQLQCDAEIVIDNRDNHETIKYVFNLYSQNYTGPLYEAVFTEGALFTPQKFKKARVVLYYP